MLMRRRADVLAKIAAGTAAAIRERERHGLAGSAVGKRIAWGDGWSVSDVICTCGPRDPVFEEEHARHSIGVVLSGTFQYRSTLGRHVMTPGSLLLGNAGDRFECDHDHAVGDRCIAFHYTSEYLDTLARGLDERRTDSRFRSHRMPPLKTLTDLVARSAVELARDSDARWEELAIEFAAAALSGSERPAKHLAPPRSVVARLTDQIRSIEADPSRETPVSQLASEAGISTFAYLRTFERLTGVTPHQFILRARLRHAATWLLTDRDKVIEVALGSGFADVSNFNRAFRREVGLTPTAYRARSVATP